MVVEDVAVPALYFGTAEIVAIVEIDRDQRAFLREDLLATFDVLAPLRRVAGVAGGGDGAIVFRVFPTGLVVAVLAVHDVEERAGVEVVADPRETRDLVMERAHRVVPHLALLVVE